MPALVSRSARSFVSSGLIAIGTSAALAGCGPTAAERTARSADSIVAIAQREGHVFRGTVSGHRVSLMVHECKVYDLADPPRKDGRRSSILEPEFYPWPTVCSRQSIDADTSWVTVHLGRTGFGAGGCCATGGTYRSRDGRVWERTDSTVTPAPEPKRRGSKT